MNAQDLAKVLGQVLKPPYMLKVSLSPGQHGRHWPLAATWIWNKLASRAVCPVGGSGCRRAPGGGPSAGGDTRSMTAAAAGARRSLLHRHPAAAEEPANGGDRVWPGLPLN